MILPREDRPMRVMAFTMVALMTVLTTLRACQIARHGGICAVFEAKARAFFDLEDPS